MFCRRVEEFLTEHGIAYRGRNIAEDPEALDELMRLGVATTPVTVIDGYDAVPQRAQLVAWWGTEETDPEWRTDAIRRPDRMAAVA
ncbi:MAG TPA: glutaredoxin family protein [bacterium]|nr:glutaredoxin family protein [bacterium]